jgi:hypothetical protein
MIERLKAAGVSEADAFALRRISMTLHRWHELECGDGNDYASWSIERDEVTDKPYMVTHPHTGKSRRHAVPDREKGALKRLDALMAKYSDKLAYVQGDPRGASLYVLNKRDVKRGEDIESVYNRGIAVYG